MSDQRYMGLALSLGRRGLGHVWPNPAVGCVIVRDGRIVGRGWTQTGGRPHAETMALMQAGAAARGATAYVTLEPCAHHGQTPPCAESLISAGLVRVVVAANDPDPRVNGAGLAMLTCAGISVTTGVLQDQAEVDNRGFLLRIVENRPMVTLKLANSFDGRIATAQGESRWITGPDARRHVHVQRAIHDAVMIGAGTARADDPSLDVRELGVARQPVRVVVSRQLDLPLEGKLARTAKAQPLWLCHGPDADPALCRIWSDLGARLFPCRINSLRQIDMSNALTVLAEAGLTRVFCEGGGSLAASLLLARQVDQMIGYTAGVMLGADARPSLGPMHLNRLAEAQRFRLAETCALGPDVMHRWLRE